MEISGLHILLTYSCNFECDHCFAWGSPWQSGTLTLQQIHHALKEARETGTVKWIYFEGGEPFLYYPILLKAVQVANEMGFNVGIVTNAYWATCEEDALEWLKPFAGLVQDLSASSDTYHYDEKLSLQVNRLRIAAEQLGLATGVISIARPGESASLDSSGQLQDGESGIMFRGRAAEKLAGLAPQHPWTQFTECPHEDLEDPGRIHLDPCGYLHLCQGIVIGNIFQSPLKDICQAYHPQQHPILGPLLDEGPFGLVQKYTLPHREKYADACHMCYEARLVLRSQFPNFLTPDQMYGVIK